MGNYCCSCDDVFASKIQEPWGITRCNMGKYLNQRCLVYDDTNNSPCNSPFTAPTTTFNIVDYFPVSFVKFSTTSNQLEDNKGKVTIVCDKNQNLKTILNDSYKLIILDIQYENVVVSGRIDSWQAFTTTDIDILFSLIRNPYKYDKLVSLDYV